MTRKSKLSRNNRGGRNSVVQRGKATFQQERVSTAISRSSRHSKTSGGSNTSSFRPNRGLGSVKRKMNSIFDHYLHSRDDEEVDKDVHIYDSVFGKKIVRRVTNSQKCYIEKMKFDQFKRSVRWGNSLNFPEFLIELIRYLTGFNIHEYLDLIKAKEQEDKDQ